MFEVAVLAAVPALILIDGAPAIFLMAAIPGAHLYSLPSHGLGGIKIVTALVLGCWVIGAHLRRQSFRLQFCALDVAVGGLFVVALVNIAVLSNPESGANNLFLEYGGSLLLYGLIRGTVYSKPYLRAVLTAFVASSVIDGVLAIWRYERGLGQASEHLKRLSLPGGDISNFAGILLAASAVALGMALCQRGLRLRGVWLAAPLILAAAIVLSYSRQVFVSAGAMAVAAILFSRGLRLRLAGAAAMLVAALVAFTRVGKDLGLSAYIKRMGGIHLLNYQATSGRNIAWSMGLHAFKNHFLFGVGIGNYPTPEFWFPFAYRQHVSTTFLSASREVHSLYLGWAADGGIVALLFLAAAILTGAVYLVRLIWSTPIGTDVSAISHALLLAYVGYYVSQAATPAQTEQMPYILLSVTAGAWTVAKRERDREPSAATGAVQERARPPFQVEGAVAAVALGSAVAIFGGVLGAAARARLEGSVSPYAYLPFVSCASLGSACLPLSSNSSTQFALPYDSKIPVKQVVAEEQKQHVGYVWGATATSIRHGSVYRGASVEWAAGWCAAVQPASKRCSVTTPPSPSWLEKYHPSWIEWKVNGRGEPVAPAGDPAKLTPSIDFTNPAVQKYWVKHFVVPYLREGSASVDWGPALTYNAFGAGGHYGPHHHFVHQYSGRLRDTRWAAAQGSALGAILRETRLSYPAARFGVEAASDCFYAPKSSWLETTRYASAVFDWEGYTQWGGSPSQPNSKFIPDISGHYCGDRWLFKTKLLMQMQKAGKRVVLFNVERYPITRYMTDTNPEARADVEWTLANYYMVKYSHTYFWFGNESQYGYPMTPQREEMVNIGKQRGDMHAYQYGYIRKFSKGMALVDPSPAAPLLVKLPRGRYQDLYGQKMNQVTLPPHSGLILVTRTSVR